MMILFLALQLPFVFSETFFFEHLQSTTEVPFIGDQVHGSRIKMLEEMGRKYPGLSCRGDCQSSQPDVKKACELGLIGGVHLITSNQYYSGRSGYNIWNYPNSSLTVDAYGYMLEYEAGINCSSSKFVERFPTRKRRSGESAFYIDQKNVCESWHKYFKVANNKNVSSRKKLRRLWEAHGLALYHSYWQYADEIQLDGDNVPLEEYRIWLSWSRFVGAVTPRILRKACGSEAYPIARVLMPKCIFGELDEDGNRCKISKKPKARHKYFETWLFLKIRKALVSERLKDLMRSFERGMRLKRTRYERP